MTIGFVCGAFDLLHAGHVNLLKQCKRSCDYLVVGLHVDPSIENPRKNKPIESLLERQIRLIGSKYVDEIVIYEKEKDLSIIFKNRPDINIRFLGMDYVKKQNEITAEDDIKIEYIDSIPIHTSDLRERIKKS